jgi:hypothetical protein
MAGPGTCTAKLRPSVYPVTVRLILLLTAVLAACSPAPPQVKRPKPDPVSEPWYSQTVEQLKAMNRDAENLVHHGGSDRAAAIITNGQPLIHRLLSVPYPTLSAMEAVSDLDQLYGRMLLSNRHYVWARVLFQKNLTRWSNWTPQTPDTLRRLKMAREAVAECDRHGEE